LIVALFPYAAFAQTCDNPVAQVTSVQGTVEARRAGTTQWQTVQLHDAYCPGDTLRVQDNSRADVALANESLLRLSANTTITLEALQEERTSVVDLVKGLAHFFSRRPRSLEVKTPFTVAGVRGTEFFISVDDLKTFLSIFDGQVLAANQAGSLTLSSGQAAVAEAGKAPVRQIVARPRHAVRWALYYPPVLYIRPDEFPAGSDWQGMVRKSVEFYQQGDLQKAFDSLQNLPEDVRNPRVFAYRAALRLTVGQVEAAQADIARALGLAANDSNALALQTIIAIVQNETERALRAARQAVETAPRSATAHIALSYAQQALFDLPGARSSLEKAVQLEPNNALAWARLAELHSSFAELGKALSAAQKAVALEPNLSRTQTVLGFAYLMQVNTAQARAAFEKAIALDQADPLPRLGLGLANIRDGKLAEGRRDLETAGSLDPNNALVRSYLGKAYYEEKRAPLDEREYKIAKELDPNDPTPWFYDAIAKQTTNRPVEALQALQKAIELNDNRAVYRSRLSLDSDLAARSASLGRIYSDLGFQQLALVEGWKSVNTDPTNFSAHRFLADSYAVLPRHEIARVSELLQSQLLQPLNLTPIQPRLAESNLFLISAGGPGALSFNEFNPIFNRNGVTLQASGLAGENSTYAGEGVVAGIYKNMSFSVGGFHYTTDGFRANADQQDDIANAFIQWALSPYTSVQTEYRYRNRHNGDLELRFFRDDFRRIFAEKEERHSIRVGLHHALAPNSILLGSFMYQHRDTSAVDRPIGAFVTLIDEKFPDQESLSWEVQHVFRSPAINLVSGAGYFDIDAQRTLALEFDPLFGIPPSQTTSDENVEHTNLYVYAYISLLKNVTITVGGSGDFFHTDSATIESRGQFNPKFGVTWNLFPNTTLRVAVFRVLKRTLITDQTLEPTQVAGFNQFFDDINATDSWRYGGAIDQKFSPTLFGGLEVSERILNIPFEFIDPITTVSEVRRGDAKEMLGRIYLFWTPHPWLALSTEYQYERFNIEKNDAAFDFKEVMTHRVPFGISFFHPTGLSALLKATYFNQEGDFIRRGLACCEFGADNFWIIDTAISYRLPKRRGFITLGATNLFDERFRYFDTDRGAVHRNPRIIPDRVVFGRVTVALP
jgi:tetratricopeptide (TPR) repeat protein